MKEEHELQEMEQKEREEHYLKVIRYFSNTCFESTEALDSLQESVSKLAGSGFFQRECEEILWGVKLALERMAELDEICKRELEVTGLSPEMTTFVGEWQKERTPIDNDEENCLQCKEETDLYMEKTSSVKRLEDNLHRLVSLAETQGAGDGAVKRLKAEKRKEPVRGAVFSPEERDRMTEKLKEIIMEHLDDPELSSKLLSQELGLSRSKFYRELKHIDGLSLSDYIRNVRLEKAENLLAHSAYTAREVVDMTGFVNLSHFSKIFKLKYGMAPVEYKRKKSVRQ